MTLSVDSPVAVTLRPDGSVDVAHTGSPDQGSLHYTSEEWTAFVLGVKAGEFDFAPGDGPA